MNGGGGTPHNNNNRHPSSNNNNDGEFLLRLVQNRQQQQQQQQTPLYSTLSPSPHLSSLDPAVAAVGPSFSLSPQNPNPFFYQGFPPPQQHQTSSFFSAPHQHFDLFRQNQQQSQQQNQQILQRDSVLFGNIPFPKVNTNNNNGVNNNNVHVNANLEREIELELLKKRQLGFDLGAKLANGYDRNHRIDPYINWGGDNRRPGGPPGFSGDQRRNFGDGNGNIGSSSSEGSRQRGFIPNDKGQEREREKRPVSSSSRDRRVGGQVDHHGLPSGSAMSTMRSGSPVDLEDCLEGENGVSTEEIDDLSEQLVDSVIGEDGVGEKNEGNGVKKKHHRDKDFRSDARGKWILPQRMRNSKRLIECRRDIDRWNASFLAIYDSLIPAEEEKAKQNQLLSLLKKLVYKEWPNAKLYLYGSCANSFGVSKSDVDVCLAIEDQNFDKSEVLLKLADILEADNLQNVQALTRARVPIVKLMDPVTGISCDICINNLLAVVNTQLLGDYAKIDVRLRQLAFLVKHWAKSRGVNETYQGTLSSYAYVLMCIHFLQLRNPPILPCLQGMEPTYTASVDNIDCAYFDQVDRLKDFGTRNRESISRLMWGFFSYWAYCHDYANTVISVRAGSILSKHEKDWTRRIGNDRHLICIEDPFELSHDLGRVVDKHSIRVLREEFERAAHIMQYDPNPCIALFEPYIPPS